MRRSDNHGPAESCRARDAQGFTGPDLGAEYDNYNRADPQQDGVSVIRHRSVSADLDRHVV